MIPEVHDPETRSRGLSWEKGSPKRLLGLGVIVIDASYSRTKEEEQPNQALAVAYFILCLWKNFPRYIS